MLNSFLIAFSTYSRIPMPRAQWDEKGLRYSLCFFPAVGAVIGLLSLGCLSFLSALGIGKSLTAAVLTAVPVMVSGGIHMDGYLDTVDAKSSCKTTEERLAILKDPHAGAFAIIYGCLYFLLTFGLFSELTAGEAGCIALGYVYSRILSGLSIVTFPKARKDGMAAAAAGSAQKSVKWVLLAQLFACLLFYLYISPIQGAVCIMAGGAAFGYYKNMSCRLFGGVTGDLAGWFLQMCEFLILGCTVILPKALQLLA